MKRFLTYLAWIISAVFHPLGMTVIGSMIFILCYFLPYFPDRSDFFHIIMSYCLPVFALYYLLPISLCAVYVFFNRENFDLNSNRHRLRMLLIVMIAYSFSLIFNGLKTNILNPYLFSCDFLLFITLVISSFWRISFHTIGIGGILGLLFYLQVFQELTYSSLAFTLIPITVITAGVIGSARLYLNAHTPSQIYVGYIVGFLGVCGGMIVY
jgi:membrane-associated phospholipid phosphatase